jgi:hypothetical protein
MKKLAFTLMAAFLSLTFTPGQLQAAGVSNAVESQASSNKAVSSLLFNRLVAIKKMDKSQLSSTEKKELRKEVRSIHEQYKKMGPGIYIAPAALIIIILLLIILL